jgi:hypothetical protein
MTFARIPANFFRDKVMQANFIRANIIRENDFPAKIIKCLPSKCHRTVNHMRQSLNDLINRIEEADIWTPLDSFALMNTMLKKRTELSINPNKTTEILSTKNRNMNGFTKSTLLGSDFKLQNKIRYLGVILDSKFNWKSHIDHKRQFLYDNAVMRMERLGDYDRKLYSEYQASPIKRKK